MKIDGWKEASSCKGVVDWCRTGIESLKEADEVMDGRDGQSDEAGVKVERKDFD